MAAATSGKLEPSLHGEKLQNGDEPQDSMPEESICYYYNTPWGCWNMEDCHFQHIRDESDGPRPICRFFGNKRGCWYGRDCYFTHDSTGDYRGDYSQGDCDEPLEKDVAHNKPRSQFKDPNNNRVKGQSEVNKGHKDTAIGQVKKDGDESAPKEMKKGRRKGQRARKNKKKLKDALMSKGNNIIKETIEEEDETVAEDDNESSNKTIQKSSKDTTSKDAKGSKSGIDRNSKKPASDAKTGDDTVDLTVSDEKMKGKDSEAVQEVCGECGEIFTDDKNSSTWQLEQHYLEMLGKADREHIKMFRKHCSGEGDLALCGACGRVFQRVEDLLRHLGSKYNLKRKEHYCHKEYFREIAHQFIDRDIGISSDDEEQMADYLMVLVSFKAQEDEHSDTSEEDDEDYSDESEVDTGMATYFSQQLKRLSKMTAEEIDAESDERANNNGFTEDEVYELMCQGIKPWDSEAYSALNVIYCYDGGDFDYQF